MRRRIDDLLGDCPVLQLAVERRGGSSRGLEEHSPIGGSVDHGHARRLVDSLEILPWRLVAAELDDVVTHSQMVAGSGSPRPS
jgi:hypothetical protein